MTDQDVKLLLKQLEETVAVSLKEFDSKAEVLHKADLNALRAAAKKKAMIQEISSKSKLYGLIGEKSGEMKSLEKQISYILAETSNLNGGESVYGTETYETAPDLNTLEEEIDLILKQIPSGGGKQKRKSKAESAKVSVKPEAAPDKNIFDFTSINSKVSVEKTKPVLNKNITEAGTESPKRERPVLSFADLDAYFTPDAVKEKAPETLEKAKVPVDRMNIHSIAENFGGEGADIPPQAEIPEEPKLKLPKLQTRKQKVTEEAAFVQAQSAQAQELPPLPWEIQPERELPEAQEDKAEQTEKTPKLRLLKKKHQEKPDGRRKEPVIEPQEESPRLRVMEFEPRERDTEEFADIYIQEELIYDEPKSKGKKGKEKSKIRTRITGAIFYSVLVAIIGTAFFLGSQGGSRSVLGYSIFSVLTQSMQSEIPQGSLVIVKEVDTDTIQVGDDITFLQQDQSTVTHRVVDIYEDYGGQGIRGFQTKGLENNKADEQIVYEGNVVGVVAAHFPGAGEILSFIRDHAWKIVIAVALILMLVFSLYTFLKANKEVKQGETKKPLSASI